MPDDVGERWWRDNPAHRSGDRPSSNRSETSRSTTNAPAATAVTRASALYLSLVRFGTKSTVLDEARYHRTTPDPGTLGLLHMSEVVTATGTAHNPTSPAVRGPKLFQLAFVVSRRRLLGRFVRVAT